MWRVVYQSSTAMKEAWRENIPLYVKTPLYMAAMINIVAWKHTYVIRLA
jgi:hypothetical protein